MLTSRGIGIHRDIATGTAAVMALSSRQDRSEVTDPTASWIAMMIETIGLFHLTVGTVAGGRAQWAAAGMHRRSDREVFHLYPHLFTLLKVI